MNSNLIPSKIAESNLLAALKNIPADVTVICDDDNFHIISAIVSARSEPLKRMLDGSMKEGISRIIRFPGKKRIIVEAFMYYLQFAKLLAMSPLQYVELYILADTYGANDLIEDLSKLLTHYAKSPKNAFYIYQICSIDILAGIKEIAYETIKKYLPSKQALFICDTCKVTANVNPSCNFCVEKSVLKTVSPCQNGHLTNFDELYCKNYIYIPTHTFCPGKLIREIQELNTENISAETFAEIFVRYHNLN
jgi:hypothetical protein